MRKPYVLVAIPFKSQVKLLKEAVFSFLESYVSGMTFSIILWDDGSKVEELDELYNSIPRQVTIVRHENVGYTKAVHNIVNFCKSESRIDYLLLCNSDIKMRKGSFYSIVNRMLTNNNIGAVGGKVLKYGTDEIQHTGTIIDHSCENNIGNPYCGLNCNDPRTNHVERRLWANGCCTLYNIDILKKFNLNFDIDNFSPAYFEEASLQTQMNLLGVPVLYEPRCEVEHVVNASHNEDRQKYERVFWNNWNKYLEMFKDKFDHPMLNFGK